MDEKLKEKLKRILNELPSENSCLDYKVGPYPNNKKADFIKDLNGFLNSNDGYGKDKFIIFGINDKKERIGINVDSMPDGNEFQTLAEKISPIPSIAVGTIEYRFNEKKLDFGYVYIPEDKNDDRVYTINSDFPKKETIYKDIRDNGKITISYVLASTACISRDSSNGLLTEEERRRIYELDSMNKNNRVFNQITQYDLSKANLDNKIMKMVTLVGGWDENNKKDKEIVSELIGYPYENVVIYLRQNLNEKNSYLSFKNEKWRVDNRLELLKVMSSNYFKEEILSFQEISIKVLSSYNPKFDLTPDKRKLVNIYNKKPKYSELLQQSISETLPMVVSICDSFRNCKDTIKNMSLYVINEVLNSTNWKLWASLEGVLPSFAEAEPSFFIKKLEEKIKNEPRMIEELMTASERYVIESHYTTGLYWALQLIAWQERYLVSVCLILAKLFKYDNKSLDIIAGILLPWFPQTLASIEIREVAVKTVLKEDQTFGWKLLMELMPNKRAYGSHSYKPKWNNIVVENEKSILRSDYWKQIEIYLELILEASEKNVHKLCQVIDLFDDVPEYMVDKITDYMSQQCILNLSDEEKYHLWDKIEDFINKHTKFSDADWSLPKTLLDKVKKLSGLLKPNSLLVYNKRYFKRDFWMLYDEKLDYDTASKKLNDYRINVLKTIVEIGFNQIFDFVKEVEDPYVVGFCLGEITISEEQEKKTLFFLDSDNDNLCLFAKGFAYEKYYELGDNWLNGLDIESWNVNQKVNLLIILPKNNNTWKKVAYYLGKEENFYWEKVDIHVIEKGNDINYPLKKILDVERIVVAINIIGYAISAKMNYDRKYAIKALNEMLNMQESINSTNIYYIQEIIKDLQQSDISKDEMFGIEWSYLLLLDDVDCRPITIEKELSNNPEIYVEILKLAYKPMKAIEEEYEFDKTASNAYRLLHNWKTPPGLNEKNQIDRVKLNNWYEEMRGLCEEADRLEVGLINFGRVLFYSPKDINGLWIDESVAEILNDEDAENIRHGFSIENYNSLGVVIVDPEGKIYDDLAEEYESKAKSIEMAGYNRVAIVMRELSDTYRRDAERTRERYGFDD